MSVEDIMNFKNYYKKTEVLKIHEELFHDSPEYKYYILGIAQAWSWLREIFKEDNNLELYSTNNIRKLLDNAIELQDDELTKIYYKRIVENNQ